MALRPLKRVCRLRLNSNRSKNQRLRLSKRRRKRFFLGTLYGHTLFVVSVEKSLSQGQLTIDVDVID